MDMEKDTAETPVPESPRPTAFTIDFGDEKRVDLQRHKTLTEKFQQRHKRGTSMSKLESGALGTSANKRYPLSGNLPRKASFQSEDERSERCKSAGSASKKSDLTLPLENTYLDRMTHSFPSEMALLSFNSTGLCDLQNVSSPELDLISPYSPKVDNLTETVNLLRVEDDAKMAQNGLDNDFDRKSDTLSETGTYTLEADNYSAEQKARMSIDSKFKIEALSLQEKTEEYVRSLMSGKFLVEEPPSSPLSPSLQSSFSAVPPVPPLKTNMELTLKTSSDFGSNINSRKALSPILSPTQNMSITSGQETVKKPSNLQKSDEGSVISVSSSGAFRSKGEEKRKLEKKLSLSKSEVHVEAYIDGKIYNEEELNLIRPSSNNRKSRLSANIVNVQSIEMNNPELGSVVSASFSFGKAGNVATVTTGLPPTPTGKLSPSKIPSPIHTMSRPRNRNSLSATPDDFDTDSILKPTRNYINSLQQKLSLDNSDQDSDYEIRYGLQLNNTAHLLKQRALHIRHNSLDDKAINNKLEHFQSKNLQPIDQTYTNVFGQYPSKMMNKINNSPSNSPIRRSNSFSNRNQINNQVKSVNVSLRKDSNLCNSPLNDRVHRSSSTACIKANYLANQAVIGEHKKIDRNQFGDTESSSEDDLGTNNVQKRKDLGTLSNTRCNRTFSLRRARVDSEANKAKCPNTPDMRRKTLQPIGSKQERAISMDRKPVKTNEVQSRYLLSLNKRASLPAKEPAKPPATKPAPPKGPNNFARGESGRFSMRAPKASVPNAGAKNPKKDAKIPKQNSGARSNSSLSSREVDFQNWKRRKSYDPMKAAAEGKKKKEIEKRLTGTLNATGKTRTTSPDSSPSHSGSVHRSQSFHGTAALEQLISSEEDLTFSADEGLSPPTPSPCELSPTKASLRHSFWDRIRN